MTPSRSPFTPAILLSAFSRPCENLFPGDYESDTREPGARDNTMPIPPLVARELLVYSRQPWTYWLRLLSALGAVSVLIIMATTGQHRLGRSDGLSLFAGSTVILFFIASLNGLRSTFNCIGSERRQG